MLKEQQDISVTLLFYYLEIMKSMVVDQYWITHVAVTTSVLCSACLIILVGYFWIHYKEKRKISELEEKIRKNTFA
jgi:lipid-A-disaccharide synthase-like uncharacterized protein